MILHGAILQALHRLAHLFLQLGGGSQQGESFTKALMVLVL